MLSILKGFKTSQRHADVQVCNVSVEKSHSCFKMAQAAGLLAECPGLLLTVPVCNSFPALGLCLGEVWVGWDLCRSSAPGGSA